MTLLLPILLLASAQAAAPPATPVPAAPRLGRGFISPMGEPVFGRTANEDGLVAWFASADANNDGMITPDEMSADAARFFGYLDTDKDGEIGPEEIERYETQIAPQVRVRAAMENSTGGSSATAEATAGRYGLLQIPEPVISADSNFNRGVSLEEFKQAAQVRFQLLDSSHSGRLTLPQLQATRRAAIAAANRRPVEQNDNQSSSPGIADSVGRPNY